MNWVPFFTASLPFVTCDRWARFHCYFIVERLPAFITSLLFVLLISYLCKMCELMEVDGLSAWIYSDGAMGDEHNPGLMYRDSYPGSPRKIVLAELEYTQSWNDFDDFDSFAL